MIYVVEDDASIRDLMIYTLNVSGLEASGYPDGAAFFAAVGQRMPALVILDVMLPGMDGIEILKRLRSERATADIPVIMATAKDAEYDKVAALNMGADDYITKPFGVMEMVSRVRAVLRRCARNTVADIHSSAALMLGKITLNEEEHTCLIDGERVSLTLKEYELLKLFMENPKKVFSRDTLLSAVWGLDFVGESRTVDVHIGTLRTKLGVCGDYIETVRGVGYKIEEK